MSFSIPNIPQIDMDSVMGALTKAFDASATVGAVTGNITNQQSAIESIRKQLDDTRNAMQLATSVADFKAMADYTAGMQQMTDVACVMSSVKPAYTPLTPDVLSNPLGSTGGGLLSDAIGAYLGVDPKIVDAAMSGDVESLTSPDTLTDLAIAGAGAYISAQTGGVIPPQMASSVVQSVAGDAIKSNISSITANGTPTGISTDIVPNIAKDAIMADTSGQLLGATLAQTTSKAVSAMGTADIKNFNESTGVSFVEGALQALDDNGFANPYPGLTKDSLLTATETKVLDKAATTGNIKAAKNMLETLDGKGLDKSMFSEQVKKLCSNSKLNQTTASLLPSMYQDYVPSNASSLIANGVANKEVRVSDITGISKSLINSKMSEKIFGADAARKTKAIAQVVNSQQSSNPLLKRFSKMTA